LVAQVRNHPGITILEHHFAVDLLTQHHLGEIVTKHSKKIVCFGAYVLDLETGVIDTFRAKFTVLATGGVGNVYHTTTNPQVATGDGIAMVHRAKGLTRDMEFIQFHPTSLYNPGERPSFLISEAMRGFGAVLRLPGSGEEFMQKYHPMGSLAPRDIVARSIDHEMKIHGYEYVYLDVTSRKPQEVIDHFPTIYEKCLSLGIDITRQMIPVVPAAHYCTGGIEVNLNGESSINRLYALGECARTGLHGANRLASNSLIEALVYADQAALHAAGRFNSVELQEGIPDWNDEGTAAPEEMVLITQNVKEMQQIMSNYVGIVRSNLRLERAMRRLHIIWRETEELYVKTTPSQALCELRNMITTGYLIIKQASARHQSIGLHYSTDYI
jgi:L-aspartate oxidase